MLNMEMSCTELLVVRCVMATQQSTVEGGNSTAVTRKYAASLDAVQKGNVPWPLVGIEPLFSSP